MKTFTDTEIAQQLEQLAQVIETSLSSSRQLLANVEQVRTEVKLESDNLINLKAELQQLCQEMRTKATEIHDLYTNFQNNLNTTQQINQDVESHIHQIDNYEQLVLQLHQELIDVRVNLESAQSKFDNFEQRLPQLNDKLPQHLEEIKQLTQQIHQDKIDFQQLTQTTHTEITAASQTNHQSQQLLNQIQTLFEQIGGQQGLDSLQQEYKHTNQSLENTHLEMERLQQKFNHLLQAHKSLKIWLIITSIGVVSSILIAFFK